MSRESVEEQGEMFALGSRNDPAGQQFLVNAVLLPRWPHSRKLPWKLHCICAIKSTK